MFLRVIQCFPMVQFMKIPILDTIFARVLAYHKMGSVGTPSFQKIKRQRLLPFLLSPTCNNLAYMVFFLHG